MATYAIIQLAGKQFQVAEGDQLIVDRLETAEGETITVTDVLLVGDDKTQTVGTPLVAKASVTLKVTTHQKGKKLRVGKFKAKSRYRKVQGHRQHQTMVDVVKISA